MTKVSPLSWVRLWKLSHRVRSRVPGDEMPRIRRLKFCGNTWQRCGNITANMCFQWRIHVVYSCFRGCGYDGTDHFFYVSVGLPWRKRMFPLAYFRDNACGYTNYAVSKCQAAEQGLKWTKCAAVRNFQRISTEILFQTSWRHFTSL